MPRTARFLVLGLFLVACDGTPTQTDPGVPPSMSIEDAVHNDGNDRFYFLPPLVDQPSTNGAFDAALSPTVEICALDGEVCTEPLIAEYSTSTGPGSETVRLEEENEQYIVNWHTDEFDLDAETTYRIRVLAGGTLLGHADVDVVNNGNELKNVDTDEFIALKDGRTLPIKFRIEVGAVFVMGDQGGEFTAEDGRVQMSLPAGALPDGEEIGITVKPTTDYPLSAGLIDGTVYEFGPDGTEFAQPVTLTLAYDEANLPAGVDEADLALLGEVDGMWEEFPGSQADVNANTITGEISGFSAKAGGQKAASVLVLPVPDLVLPATLSMEAVVLSAAGDPLNRRLGWSSSDTNVATVDKGGLLTAVGPGTVTIRAVSGGVEGSTTLSVIGPFSACEVQRDADVATCIVNYDPAICGGDPLCESGILADRANCIAAVEQACEDCKADAYQNKITFNTNRDGNDEIYLMNGDGSGVTNLTNSAGLDFGPVWSPTAPVIAFRSDRTGNCDVFTLNVESMELTRLTSGGACDQNPAWSPDGSKIAFQSGLGTAAEIFVVNADGTGLLNVTNTAGADFEPVWSPDGTKIAFQSNRDGATEIYVMNANGTGQTNLTNNAAADRFPQWSPDGTKIAFESERDGSTAIYVMDADGNNPTLLRMNAGRPAWSPDGTKIAFEFGDLYVMNANGSGVVNLAPAQGQDRSPSWSRDGTKIVFDSQQDGGMPEIYVVNVNGTGLTRLTFDPGWDQRASWQRW